MQPPKQVGKHLRKRIKQRMLDRGEMTVRQLAKRLGHDEAVISKAINHGVYPRVQAKIREALDV